MLDRASERLQDQIIEEALQLAGKEHDLWMYQHEKEEAKILQAVEKPRKDEEMAWAPPRNKSDWPDWEEARKMEESEWRLEPEGEAEVPGITIVSDAVDGTFADLDGESRHAQEEAKLSRRGREILNEGEEIRSPKKESDSGGIRRNTELCERSKGYGTRGRERVDVRTERGECSAKALVSL